MSRRLVILGGGLAGLTTAKLLHDRFDEVLILEKDSEIFGLCRTKKYSVDGFPNVPVDIHGGHIFNTKDQRVADFMFGLLPKEKWNALERNAKIYTDGRIIGWPFEFNLYEFGNAFMEKCLNEMYGEVDYSNLAKFILTKYGKTACDKYYRSYNEKIWEKPLDKIGTNWIQPHKTPVMHPDCIRIRNVPGSKDIGMTHSQFFYPKNGGFQHILEGLKASIPNLVIRRQQENYQIVQINDQMHLKFKSGYLPVDTIVSTIPVNSLRVALQLEPFPWLQHHGTDFVVVETDFFLKHPEITWCYFPDRGTKFHKIGNIAYTHQSNHPIALIDAPFTSFRTSVIKDKISGKEKTILENPNLPGYKFRTLDIIHHPYTYPIEPAGHQEELADEIKKLETNRIYSVGRWGLHSYDNCDITIGKCFDLAERIRNG